MKGIAAKLYARKIVNKTKQDHQNAIEIQEKILFTIIRQGSKTQFGKKHNFHEIKTLEDFQKRVPIYNYESFKPFIDKIRAGKRNITWGALPLYFAKTSGTTSGTKYIPITEASIKNHINTAQDALLHYIHHSKNTKFFTGKMMFISGSPTLTEENGIKIGRLSGIVHLHIPKLLLKNRMPSLETNKIEDWETKIEQIVDDTVNENLTLLSGIPPWVQMYFDRLQAKTNKSIKDIFPKLSLLVHGGVNFKPYEQKLMQSMGKQIDAVETYPASEGFFAYQDNYKEDGLLLNINSGIFYEFIPLEEIENENPTRLTLRNIELNKNYAIIISSNAGLWSYSIGDTIKFISKKPYKILVTGRVKHFISAFGEHVIAEEVEKAMLQSCEKFKASVTEFTVAPQVNPTNENELPHHEWFVEFENAPENLEAFANDLDQNLQNLNSYYKDLIVGKVLKPLKINALEEKSFQKYMKSIGKLGGQNKVPRLSNNRKIADAL